MGKIGFVYAGQGSQVVGMGHSIITIKLLKMFLITLT